MKNYLVVPISILPLMNSPQATVDYELASCVVRTEKFNPQAPQNHLKWPCSLEGVLVQKAFVCSESSLFETES